MNNEKTEALKSKRLKLQEEIRLKDFRKRVASQIAVLDQFGGSYFVYYEFEHLNWIASNVLVRKRDGYSGSHGDFQIDVDDTNAKQTINFREEELTTVKFKELISSSIPFESKIVVCYQGGAPELEISLTVFLENPSVFFSSPETWILTADKNWIIESIWEQEIIRLIQLEGSIPTLAFRIDL